MVQIFRECNELVWVDPAWSSSVIDVVLWVWDGCYGTEKCLCPLRKNFTPMHCICSHKHSYFTHANCFPGRHLSWHNDIFAHWGVQLLWHFFFFFFPLLYRLVGFDSSFNLCRVFFLFLCLVWVRHYLSTRFPVCACACVAVLLREMFLGIVGSDVQFFPSRRWLVCRGVCCL